MIPSGKEWLAKFTESLISTAPIAVVILIIFLVTRFALPMDFFTDASGQAYFLSNDQMVSFAVAVAMIVVGMALFNLGTEQSMTEIGRIIGGSLVRKNKFFFVIAMTFIIGVLVTIAEPDLSVLSRQVGINSQIIVWSIGVGVGLFLVVGVIRTTLHQSLNMMFLAFYGLCFALLYFIDPRFLPICFDSGGVTTGPVTVPFLLGFGLGMAANRGGKNSEDSFGLTALCSIGPILAVVIISLVLKGTGRGLPAEYPIEDASLSNIWESLLHDSTSSMQSVALSVGPILLFFIVYELIFIRVPGMKLVRIIIGMVITYVGLVLFLSAVEWGFLPIAQTVGHMFGSSEAMHYVAIGIGALFGIFGVLAEPAVHVLVSQMEQVSDGRIKKGLVLTVLAAANGVAVALSVLRCHFQFGLEYYIIPGYILAFILSFAVPKIYTAMAFDSGGVASGPMTSTFVLPFCIGFASTCGIDVYSFGFGLVAVVAMMPIIVVQALGFQSKVQSQIALAHARKRIIEENDEQIIHFDVTQFMEEGL
ncbi:MAG: DUF1538 domain-containing protein [Bacilli bacterium]|nr:DUF1538 domain-containing protein [Bacilli bacterium]